ncbi:MAG: DUF3750 domain-containing protein [Pseudomonadota bacterium]
MSWVRNHRWLAAIVALILTCSVLTMAGHAKESREAQSVLSPTGYSNKDEIVRVYGARTWGKKGIFAIHTWIVVKPSGSDDFKRYEVIGWRLRYGRSALKISDWSGETDWWGNPGELIMEWRGDGTTNVADRIDAFAQRYSAASSYVVWPGPNSNTFVAEVGRAIPELRLDLPAKAIGKHYRVSDSFFGRSVSGTGVQISLAGFFSLAVGVEEGIEIGALGINIEWDIFDLAVELPIIGRLGGSQ